MESHLTNPSFIPGFTGTLYQLCDEQGLVIVNHLPHRTVRSLLEKLQAHYPAARLRMQPVPAHNMEEVQ